MIRLHDTMARDKRVFEPADPKRITMYVCGPTVYGRAHIGNARPAVVFDTLARLIRHEYGADSLVYARNVTDVDDKIIAAAEAEGVEPAVITERYERHYLEDMGALGVAPPTIAPHATGNIAPMVAMIVCLAKLARTRASAFVSTSTKSDATAQRGVELLGDAFEPLGGRVECVSDGCGSFLGAVRGCDACILHRDKLFFQPVDALHRFRQFIGDSERRHHGEADITDLAEFLAQLDEARVEMLRQLLEMLFLPVLAGETKLAAVDGGADCRHHLSSSTDWMVAIAVSSRCAISRLVSVSFLVCAVSASSA